MKHVLPCGDCSPIVLWSKPAITHPIIQNEPSEFIAAKLSKIIIQFNQNSSRNSNPLFGWGDNRVNTALPWMVETK